MIEALLVIMSVLLVIAMFEDERRHRESRRDFLDFAEMIGEYIDED